MTHFLIESFIVLFGIFAIFCLCEVVSRASDYRVKQYIKDNNIEGDNNVGK